MKTVAVFIGLLGLLGQTKAQGLLNKTVAQKKWEIGMDLLLLIGKNNLPNYSILLRKHQLHSDGKTAAWRFRIGIDWASYSLFQPFLSKQILLSRIGYEWHKDLGQNVQLYYGIDFLHLYYEKQLLIIPNKYNLSDVDSWEAGSVGVFGGRFFINNYFSLSLESSINAVLMNRQIKLLDGLIIGGIFEKADTDFGEERRNVFLLKLYPISNLNFNIHF